MYTDLPCRKLLPLPKNARPLHNPAGPERHIPSPHPLPCLSTLSAHCYLEVQVLPEALDGVAHHGAVGVPEHQATASSLLQVQRCSSQCSVAMRCRVHGGVGCKVHMGAAVCLQGAAFLLPTLPAQAILNPLHCPASASAAIQHSWPAQLTIRTSIHLPRIFCLALLFIHTDSCSHCHKFKSLVIPVDAGQAQPKPDCPQSAPAG